MEIVLNVKVIFVFYSWDEVLEMNNQAEAEHGHIRVQIFGSTKDKPVRQLWVGWLVKQVICQYNFSDSNLKEKNW